MARLLCMIGIFCFLLSGSFALYTDGKNNTCLTVYSDQQTYHTSLVQRDVPVELFFENKCGAPLLVDFGLLARNDNTFLFKSAESFDGTKGSWQKLSLSEKSVSPSTGFVSKKGWGNLVVPVSGARVRVSFGTLVSKGEFFIYAKSVDDPKIFSLLDPWWEDGEIAPDAFTQGLWHFNSLDGDGNFFDSSGNNFDMNITNALMLDVATKYYGAGSASPQATYWGTQSEVFDTVPAQWTVGAWVSPTANYPAAGGNREFFDVSRGNSGANKLFCVWLGASGKLGCGIDPAGTWITGTTVNWVQDTWYYIQIIYDGTNLAIRVNGVQEAITASANLPNGIENTFLLGMAYDGSNKSLFRVDELEVADTNRALNFPGAAGGAAFSTTIEKVEGSSAYLGFPVFSYFLDKNLTIDFNVLNSDNNRLYVDINYGITPWVGGGTVIVKDLNIVSSMCLDGNNNWGIKQATCSWDWNISGVVDANYYVVLNVKNWNYKDSNVSDSTNYSLKIDNIPDLNITFWDENHFGLKLVGITASFNGTTKTVNPTDGNVDFSLEDLLPGVYPLLAWQDNNYALRYFDINYIGNSITINPRLLRDVNGNRIDFKFYNELGTSVLSSPFITVYRGWGDWNIVEQRQVGATGETSFFLHPDTNYVFKVNSVYYYPVLVSTQLPKNEISLAAISPFDLTVSGIGLKQFLGNAAAPIRIAFPNTVAKYIFDVNAGLSYYNRKYFLDFKGNPLTYSLQPYLVARADSIQSVFFVRNSFSAAGLPNIRIQSQKNIPTQGTVTVEDVITDSAGEAAMSFVVNDTYYLYFYRDGIMVYSIELRPTATSYQIYLDTETFEVGTGILFRVDCNFVPIGGMIFVLADGMVDLNQLSFVSGTTLLNTRVVVVNDTNTVYDWNFDANTGSQFFQQQIVGAGLKNLAPLKVTVYVQTTGGNFVFTHSYSIHSSTSVGAMLFNSLKNVLPGELGGTGLIIFSLLIIIIITGMFASTITGDPSGLGIVACIVAGILTYIGWIPGVVFAAMVISAIVIYIVTHRWEYQ